MTQALFQDSDSDVAYKAKWWTSRIVIYGVLILWTIVCLFPIYWTITTTFKAAPNVMQGHLIPFVDFKPHWLGWRSLGLSPDTIGLTARSATSSSKRFFNSAIVSVSASVLAVILGSLAAYGLSRFGYRFGYMKNADISFFFLSQLILPPVVLALPFLVLYKELALLDTHIGLILLYTLTVLPIVIWIMRDQFMTIPTELEEAALVDGRASGARSSASSCPSRCRAWWRPSSCPWCLTWNEYFFAALLTSTNAKTLPVMVASQTGSQGINWWSMAALSFAAILPLIIVGILLERFIIRGMSAGSGK